MAASFYITLPSNSSLKHYPDNKPSHFFTKLPQMIELNGSFEVGLSEIQFPNSFFNVNENEVYFEYIKLDNLILPASKTHKVVLLAGLYENAEYFVTQLNALVKSKLPPRKDTSPPLKFIFNRANKKVSVSVYEPFTKVSFSEALQDILGMPDKSIIGDGTFHGTDMVDPDRDLKSVYVYCDLVASRPVGDVLVPLLRTVPIINKEHFVVFREYIKPHYVALSRFQFDTVEILLMTDSGKKVPFTTGKSVVTLHFRRSRAEL